MILSDGWISFSSVTNKNARLGFAQSLAHFEYLWFVFTLLSHYCSSYPTFRNRTRFGKLTYSLQFFTRSLPYFTQLHSLFYVNGIKVKPPKGVFYNLLTPAALAHWIMGDGNRDGKGNGLLLCTNSFSIKETVRLINVLMIRYRFDCTLRLIHKGEPVIYIRVKSMPSLRSVVIPQIRS